jgi:hypothetical protein
VLITRGPIFYSQGDETAFFTWVRKITLVQGVSGRGRDLELRLRSGKPTRDELSELRALFHRYGLDTTDLAELEGAR